MELLNSKTKILVVTGGVFSSLGKGIACSSIGALLKHIGFNVLNMKFDPYLNIDAGTMSPYQHGEVFVTWDGKETDLDIGNYERFLNTNLPSGSNITSGKIYSDVLMSERDGKYLGKTIQVIPHITNEINASIIAMANNYKPDFLVVEVGGTVGDIESIPFLEACRQLRAKYENQVLMLHTVPIIEMLTSKEEKTKPLQHSVKELMSLGITPNLLLIRSKNQVSEHKKEKISLTCGINVNNIFTLPNQDNIYFLPEYLLEQNLHNVILSKLGMEQINVGDLGEWTSFTMKIKSRKNYKCRVAVIGKYTDVSDAYSSIVSSLEIAAYYANSEIKIDLINSENINSNNVDSLSNYDGILIPGGFGNRGIEGKVLSIKYARENNIPLFGICLGMQLACIEFARNVLNLHDANSYEMDENTEHPIFLILEGKYKDKNLGGTLRLGNYDCHIVENTKAYESYQKENVIERHRHRYEFNNDYRAMFEEKGIIFSGINLENNLVEIIELANHKFFIGTQFHPEFTTKTLSPNPLFLSFIDASKYSKINN